MYPNEKADPGQANCSDCDRGLWFTGKNRRPTKCPDHQPKTRAFKEGTVLVRVPTKPSERAKVDHAQKTSEARAQAIQPVLEAMATAIWSGIIGSPEQAALIATAGRKEPITEDELKAIKKLAASDELEAAREGNPQFAAGMLSKWLNLQALRMVEQIDLIKPAQRPMAMRLGQQVLEEMGGGKLAFSRIDVNLGAPRDYKGPE